MSRPAGTRRRLRARAEAEALSGLVGAALAEHRTLTDVLGQVRRVFGMREAALLERTADGWAVVEASADEPRRDDETELTVASGADLLLRVRGPELFAADRRVLASFADAAAGALHGRRVAAKAAEAAQLARGRPDARRAAGRGRPRPAHAAGLGQGRGEQPPPGRRDVDAATSARSCSPPSRTAPTGCRAGGNLLDASPAEAGVVSASLERVRLEELVGRALIGLRQPRPRRPRHPGGPARRPRRCRAGRTGAGQPARERAAARRGGRGDASAGWRRPARSRARSSTTARGSPPRSGDGAVRAVLRRRRARHRRPRTGGLGLGLAVARGFAEAMGGGLTPADDAGRRSDHAADPASPAGPMSTVCVVDDDPALVRRADHQPAGARLRRATRRPPAPARCSWPPPIRRTPSSSTSACRPRRHGGDRRAARLDRRPDPRALGTRAVRARRSPRSTPAPTTTWSSRSAWTSCWPGCGRRSGGGSAPAEPTIVTDDFTVDLARAARDRAGGTDIRLTPTEWHLLEVLARNAGKVVDHAGCSPTCGARRTRTRRTTCGCTWPRCAASWRPTPAHPRHLLTESGRGYRFEP